MLANFDTFCTPMISIINCKRTLFVCVLELVYEFSWKVTLTLNYIFILLVFCRAFTNKLIFELNLKIVLCEHSITYLPTKKAFWEQEPNII